MTPIAASHPGKLGDALYSLPFIRYLANSTGFPVDYYTSTYCEPMRKLMEYQSCVNSFTVLEDFVIERYDIGCQPWLMPIPDKYSKVYHCGFRNVPDRMLHQYIAAIHGIYEPLAIEYEYPTLTEPLSNENYIVIAPRGQTSFRQLFNEIAENYNTVVIGGKDEYTGRGRDCTGLDMLDTLSILSKAKGFIGLMSSQLVLANGFDIPRIGLNGVWSDMRHAINTARNIYPKEPEKITLADIKFMLDN